MIREFIYWFFDEELPERKNQPKILCRYGNNVCYEQSKRYFIKFENGKTVEYNSLGDILVMMRYYFPKCKIPGKYHESMKQV